ncbi:MAG: NOB1 family endonuclease [Candidatus Bathyarchaeota archaeon]
MGYDPLSISGEQFTTSSVINELHPNTTPHTRLELALETGKVKIHSPSQSMLEEIEETSRRVGDITALSRADKDVLATALTLSKEGFSTTIVSDDYALQNVAEFLGLKYVSLTTLGIRYRFRWVLYCPACKRRYTPDVHTTVCSVCGTQLKRKVLRKKSVKGK